MKKSIHKAQIPNPAIKEFAKLVGEWKTIGTHPERPNQVLNGKSSFSWIEGGAFLIWHSEIDEKDFPAGIGIFGSDDTAGTFSMLYFDERKVSRNYEVSIENNILKYWRNFPDFSQRCSWTISDDGHTIVGKGELRQSGKTWKKDLDQTFTRTK
jgi:hypothetical protein